MDLLVAAPEAVCVRVALERVVDDLRTSQAIVPHIKVRTLVLQVVPDASSIVVLDHRLDDGVGISPLTPSDG